MSDTIRKLRLSSAMSSIIGIVLGVFFVMKPGAVAVTVTKIIGILILIFGAVSLIKELIDSDRNAMLIAMAVICLVFGIWIFADPDPISKFIPYVISILLIVHGATTIGAAANGKAIGMDDWGLLMLLGILSVVAGAAGIALAGAVRNLIMMILGVMLIYDGVSSMFVHGKVSYAAKDTVIDTEGRDID